MRSGSSNAGTWIGGWGFHWSVVVAALQKLDPIRFHQIDAAVFLSDAS